MKAAVITRHAISNYGSLLQAMATQKLIEDFGHECEIIDYIRDNESYRRYEKTVLKNKGRWNNSPVKRWLYLLLRQPEAAAAGKYFEKARRKYLNLSERFTDAVQLADNPPAADVYVTGSDQVWGPVADGTLDNAYCLAFVSGRKIAYGASFGRSEMSAQTEEYFKRYLSEYAGIAVREDSAVKLLSKMGIESQQVLDPTMAVNPEYWNEIIGEIEKDLIGAEAADSSDKVIEDIGAEAADCSDKVVEDNGEKTGRYILVYQLHNDRRLGDYARRVAKAKGLPLVRVSPSLHQISRPGRFKWCPDVGQFLSYIKNADCLITDSFHGTAFAIIFNTPFIEVLPNNGTGTRNMSILTLTGLTGRVLGENADVSQADEPIDWKSVNETVRMLRDRSQRAFRELLEE